MKTRILSLLIAFAILVTVGGVYATWLYAEQDMVAVHGHIGSFAIADAKLNNSKGTFTVNAGGAKLTIDQTSATDYTAALVAEGEIVISFTPSDTYKATHSTETEFKVSYNIKTDNDDPKAFTANDGSGEKVLFTKFETTTKTPLTLTKGDDGVYTATVQAAKLLELDLIAINSFTLDTYAKYETFSKKIGTFGNIGFEVSEAATTTT